MSARKYTKSYQTLRYKRGVCESSSLDFISEEPLLVRIDEKPYSVVMRTPGDELFQVAGFCLGEGIADSPDDFKAIGYDEHLDPNVIDIWLKPERSEKIRDVLGRRGFISQTSCGICGKELIEDLYQKLTPLEDGFKVETSRIFDCIDKLDQNQDFYQTTRCSHAALIFDKQLQEISFAEDVGRHNALDKAIGKAFMKSKLSKAGIVVLSSRNSFELVQKAARAQLAVMISNSRPTALAVEMGKTLNMTLAFPDKSELVIVCGENRIK
ncbi:MAG: formate dehydrogenase accessory sulfurtransferase FdhD [Deltaproteobacteria bacterium]|nr:formate dehydrogenase accessory sulfurtransferase FdhD [Deltaproteobacteria bacterium]